MRELMTQCDLSPPQLESDRANNSFLALLLFHHFLGEDDHGWLKSFGEYNLTDEEMRAMISAREVGAINNSHYRAINREADTLSASRHLKKLCDCGLLGKKGQGSATYYVITEKALENWRKIKPVDQLAKPTDLLAKPTDLLAKPTDLPSNPTELDVEIEKFDLPKELADKIARLGGYGGRDDVLETIVALLKWSELSLTELGKYLDRNPDYIRTTYLNELIRADIVRPTNPGKRNDPNQKYRAVRK
jgi:ATP-dependent DNA helicase RecG